MNSIVGRLVGIAACGTLGALAAWWLVAWLALDGVPGAVATAALGMVVATAAFVGWTTLGRALERGR